MSIETLVTTLLFLPLLGALINGTLGKSIPKKLVGTIATGVMFISFGLALMTFMSLHDAQTIDLFQFMSMEDFDLNFRLQVDSLSILMTLIVTGVGALIHLFSMGYMSHDKGYYKFFTYLNLFIFAMLILVLGSNYFMLFFGWEGVGICSYLLIGFHYSDEKKGLMNSVAARKAFIMNRVGDLGLIIGLFLILVQYGTLEYNELANLITEQHVYPEPSMIFAITICLFIGATGKSAQIPLFTWLPDAMAGPTPVSALIHAATMVTAGIFLVVRSNFLFELAPDTQDIMLWIGLITSLVSAFMALRQNDIKKVLAYSTVSQLGFIFVALGMGAYTAAIFHVTTHAFFKALLFLGSGSVIHAMSDEQDIRQMGGLKKYIPITHITFLIGTLAISGFPMLSGFFSKDEILAHAMDHSMMIYILLAFSALLTAIYMFRLYFVVFYGKFRGSDEAKSHLHESPLNMTLPLIVLASHFLEHGTIGLNLITPLHLSDGQTMMLMASASILTLIALVVSYIVYVKKESTPLADESIGGWTKLSANKLYVDEIYNFLFVKPTEWISTKMDQFVEIGILQKSVYGFANVVSKSGELVRKWQTGQVTSYILWMVLGIVGLIVYYLIKK